jgi:phage-related baseplate assembly protein
MPATSVINLANLPAPQVVEQISFDDILAAMLTDLQNRMAAAGQPFTALLESDPAYAILECAAYRETLIRQQANEACQAVMLAFATEGDLDQLGANVNVQRLVITPANPNTVPPTPAVMESDSDFRSRIQLSFESYTTAGSTGSYVFWGMSADPRVMGISPVSPSPGVVDIYVLSNVGNGQATSDLIANVNAALNDVNVRPLTDQVTVQSANIVEYQITAELTLYPGPDSSVVQAAAQAAVQAYATSMQAIGYDVTMAGITAALMQTGVQNVTITSPTADISIDDTSASYCTAINITVSPTTNV